MCNPRRIRVSASRQIDEAWQHEVSRTVELSATVTGEARVRQPLGTELSGQTLRALEVALAAPDSGWVQIENGYRMTVEDGYVQYEPDTNVLEIVATRTAEVTALGEARRQLTGRVSDTLQAEGEGVHYDDDYRGMTEEVARHEAERQANQNLDRQSRERIDRARREAEQADSASVERDAQANAAKEIERRSEIRRQQLEEDARRRLEAIGLRGRQAFYRVLAHGYRDAILAYARANRAEGISLQENDEVIDIEFRVSR
jgi:hypothetical protein